MDERKQTGNTHVSLRFRLYEWGRNETTTTVSLRLSSGHAIDCGEGFQEKKHDWPGEIDSQGSWSVQVRNASKRDGTNRVGKLREAS